MREIIYLGPISHLTENRLNNYGIKVVHVKSAEEVLEKVDSSYCEAVIIEYTPDLLSGAFKIIQKVTKKLIIYAKSGDVMKDFEVRKNTHYLSKHSSDFIHDVSIIIG